MSSGHHQRLDITPGEADIIRFSPMKAERRISHGIAKVRSKQPSTDQMSSNELQIHVAYHAAEQELLKHIATLDTAALLFVSAFLGKGLIHHSSTIELVLGVAFLLCGMMTVVALQLHSLKHLRVPDYDDSPLPRVVHRLVFYACAFSLVLGLGCVGLFAIDTFS